MFSSIWPILTWIWPITEFESEILFDFCSWNDRKLPNFCRFRPNLGKNRLKIAIIFLVDSFWMVKNRSEQIRTKFFFQIFEQFWLEISTLLNLSQSLNLIFVLEMIENCQIFADFAQIWVKIAWKLQLFFWLIHFGWSKTVQNQFRSNSDYQ